MTYATISVHGYEPASCQVSTDPRTAGQFLLERMAGTIPKRDEMSHIVVVECREPELRSVLS